jgi:hypothetical protein
LPCFKQLVRFHLLGIRGRLRIGVLCALPSDHGVSAGSSYGLAEN